MEVFFEPREEVGHLDGSVGPHGSGDEVELSASGPDQRVSASEVDEEPALQETGGVVGEQRTSLDKLHVSLHHQLWV